MLCSLSSQNIPNIFDPQQNSVNSFGTWDSTLGLFRCEMVTELFWPIECHRNLVLCKCCSKTTMIFSTLQFLQNLVFSVDWQDGSYSQPHKCKVRKNKIRTKGKNTKKHHDASMFHQILVNFFRRLQCQGNSSLPCRKADLSQGSDGKQGHLSVAVAICVWSMWTSMKWYVHRIEVSWAI